jgi:hypothetical protein
MQHAMQKKIIYMFFQKIGIRLEIKVQIHKRIYTLLCCWWNCTRWNLLVSSKIFLGTTYKKRENIPNGHKIYNLDIFFLSLQGSWHMRLSFLSLSDWCKVRSLPPVDSLSHLVM